MASKRIPPVNPVNSPLLNPSAKTAEDYKSTPPKKTASAEKRYELQYITAEQASTLLKLPLMQDTTLDIQLLKNALEAKSNGQPAGLEGSMQLAQARQTVSALLNETYDPQGGEPSSPELRKKVAEFHSTAAALRKSPSTHR